MEAIDKLLLMAKLIKFLQFEGTHYRFEESYFYFLFIFFHKVNINVEHLVSFRIFQFLGFSVSKKALFSFSYTLELGSLLNEGVLVFLEITMLFKDLWVSFFFQEFLGNTWGFNFFFLTLLFYLVSFSPLSICSSLLATTLDDLATNWNPSPCWTGKGRAVVLMTNWVFKNSSLRQNY